MKKIKQVTVLLILIGVFAISKLDAQNVNEFTGSFSYSEQLMTVPSPYGPGVQIGASYGANIGVNQSASEIGLGWNINLGGAIYRSVSGVPDDWKDRSVTDPSRAGFVGARGVMYFNNTATTDEILDFYKSTYKIDTPAFHFPDYDHYSISGPGIGGSLTPHLFDFASTQMNVQYYTNVPAVNYVLHTDADLKFTKKMEFKFDGDYAGKFKSRHYDTSPISGSTSVKLPNQTITDDEIALGSTQPYVGIGVGSSAYNNTTNRLATAKYVEYFTNSEINAGLTPGTPNVSTIGFINLPFNEDRTSTYFELDGIGAFRVTDESGFTYYYTIPTYVNEEIHGNYPLKNDYSLMIEDESDTTKVFENRSAPANYYIKDNNLTDTNPFIVEWNKKSKYAYSWLLTAVTGPDYVDSDDNGIVNEGDKGYWVTYDWQLWTRNFIKRTPEYGFNYSFSNNEDDNTKDLDIADASKISGKYASFSKYDQELYYLNKIQTGSHTAIMVRDVRLDEYSSQGNEYDDQVEEDLVYTMNYTGGTITDNYGILYDDGGIGTDNIGTTYNYSDNATKTVTISPSGASSINVRFNFFDMDADNDDVVRVLDGSNNVLVTYSNTNKPPVAGATFDYSTIKIQSYADASINDKGFRLGWASTKHPTVVPQLKLTRIALFTNEDYNNLSDVDSISSFNVSTGVASFLLASSDIGKDKFYNETWYNNSINKDRIEKNSLQTVEFNQDYSLAKHYPGNIYTIATATDKLISQSELANALSTETADYASSGKLTLNEITTYSRKHIKTSPSTLFSYNAEDTDDNPDYNPVKIDYWGFYKSDASAEGYSSYPTFVSSGYTDAWSMREITSPMGMTTEINYESNTYEKVFDGEGGFRGPSKMYMIKDIIEGSTVGEDWAYTLEEDNTTPSEFASLVSSQPSGTVMHCMVPYKDDYTYYINSGTFTFNSISGDLESINEFYVADLSMPEEYGPDVAASWSGWGTDRLYTGNGYIHFQLPVGEEVYGGGSRVKSIVTKNGITDSYTQEYTYSEGVTPMEADRFGEEKQIHLNAVPIYAKLRNVEYDYHRMGPGIGYTEVTVKNTGHNSTPNGKTSYHFITSDAGIDNFKVNIVEKIDNFSESCTGMGCPTPCNELLDTAYIIEVVDKFSGYWGQVDQVEITDVNDNILSRTKNEFSNLDQGMIVENYDFFTKKSYTVGAPGMDCITENNYHIICIKRNYPVIMTKQTVYTQGVEATTEYLTFDEVTGGAVLTKKTSPNEGIVLTSKSPAFRISQYADMGPKSITATKKNILAPTTYQKVVVDTGITGTTNFANYTIQTFKKDFSVRKYDGTSSKYITTPLTDQYWIADRTYNWAGTVGSIDDYGLYKQSELTAAPFDYTLASIDSKWRFGSENTLLDPAGHVIETKGFNNRFNAVKYGYGDTLQIANASNVNYASYTYSGFESHKDANDYVEGEVKVNTGVKVSAVSSIIPHTGIFMMKVNNGTTGTSNSPIFKIAYNSSAENSGLQKGRTYRASVWVHSSSPDEAQLTVNFAGGTAISIAKPSTKNVTIGNWILMNIDIEVSETPTNGDVLEVYLENSGSTVAYFDDLRVHPVDASMSATVYEPKTNRVAATLDGNNFATKYVYDAGGRVTQVWQEIEGKGLKLLKKRSYNFARGLN